MQIQLIYLLCLLSIIIIFIYIYIYIIYTYIYTHTHTRVYTIIYFAALCNNVTLFIIIFLLAIIPDRPEPGSEEERPSRGRVEEVEGGDYMTLTLAIW